jgi:hypothetical protein
VITRPVSCDPLTKARSLEDWRGGVPHVNDDLGDELFIVPFAFMLGKPH